MRTPAAALRFSHRPSLVPVNIGSNMVRISSRSESRFPFLRLRVSVASSFKLRLRINSFQVRMQIAGSTEARHRPISPPRSVFMPVMDVGVMRVDMCQPRVSVPMGMRFGLRIAWRVLVLVVLVVVVEMFVFQRLMDVLVFVSLRDVQPDAE